MEGSNFEEVAKAVQRLSPAEAEFFLGKLELAIRKRKLQLTGYLVALVLWLLTMMLALAYYGTHDGFVGWVFILPFGGAGMVITLFGRWANTLKMLPTPQLTEVTDKPPA